MKKAALEMGKSIPTLLFCAVGNFVGIPYCIKKALPAGSRSSGKVDVTEATRRRRRILLAGFFFLPGYLLNSTMRLRLFVDCQLAY